VRKFFFDNEVRKCFGLVDGRPVKLPIHRSNLRVTGQTTIGSYLSLEENVKWDCFGTMKNLKGRISRCMNLQFRLRVGKVGKAWTEHRGGVPFDGYDDFWGKAWEEVVYEGSPYFPGGRMNRWKLGLKC